MWTPKRVVMLGGGLAVFMVAYLVYSHFLGGIDGLPALPQAYAYNPEASTAVPAGPPPPNTVDQKLRMAFGEECVELAYPIKLEVRSRGMALAAKEFIIQPDGRVRLAPISLALFGKTPSEARYPEINTIRSNIAYLTFDRPLSTPTDMAKSRIIGAELIGQVNVINNRRTPLRDDDLTLFTPGPVYYKEDLKKIWTNVAVRIEDLQSKPNPSCVTGMGMDLMLATEQPQPAAGAKAAAARKNRMGAISGVERIVIRADVEMHLYVDGKSGFLGNSRAANAPAKPADDKSTSPAPAKPMEPKPTEPRNTPSAPVEKKPGDPAQPAAEKSHVVIKTAGPFTFDVVQNHAQFDIYNGPTSFPNSVLANRFHTPDISDQLVCERLQLQFLQRDAKNRPAAPREDRSLDLEIEHAHATGREVTLTSDAQSLEAHGNDFFYDARTGQSTLKGAHEMWALKEGNEIHARELRLVEQKGAQQATAIGPGRIDLLDKATGERPRSARWRDILETSRDGNFDLLVLTGDAVFEDRAQKQVLQADVLRVWLGGGPAPEKGKPESTTPADPATLGGRKPQRVHAVGKVVARSAELYIHDTDRLVIWFRDAVPEGAGGAGSPTPAPIPGGVPAAPTPTPKPGTTAPMPLGSAPPAAASAPQRPFPTAGPAPIPPAPMAAGTPAGAPATTPADKKPPRPIDLSARLVEAHLIRTGEKNELERLWTEGVVRVLQAPAGPEDKGVDIRGETLQMTRKGDANVLVVTDSVNLAQLRMDKIYIVGPVVNIDQTTNTAWVNGAGAMQMDNSSNFQGQKLERSVPLTVHWNKSMLFDGSYAEFHGGVQAEQENSRLLCQSMHVTLDRPVSLKEGDRGGPPAKVRQLVADKAVRVEDREYEKGKLVKYQRLECPELHVDNEAGETHAPGPGVVRLLQRGAADSQAVPGAAPRPAAGKPAGEQEMKLTRIKFSGRMDANNKTHKATFIENVDMVHLPSEDPNLEPNLDALPPEALILRCFRLEVFNRPENGQNNQQMMATGKAFTQSQGCTGTADTVTFHEAKDQVIYEAKPGSLVTIYREKLKGAPREKLTGKKVIYMRKTGQFQGIDLTEVEGAAR